MTTFCSL